MGGHVFQLSEEGRKANQFTKTMETLRDYTVTYYEHAADLVSLFEIPSRGVVIPEPEDEPPLLDPGDAKSGRAGPSHRGFVSWKRECTAYDLRNEVLNANLLKLFTVVLLQSSPSVRAKLEATKGYEKARTEYDCPWLFNEMRNICHHFEHTENRYLALHKATSAIINYKQGANQNTTDFYEVFKELVAVLESYGGRVHHPAAAAPGDGTVIASVGNDKAQDAYMREHCLAATFLHNSDNARYGQLKAELSNDFTKGRNEYPVTLVGQARCYSATSPQTNRPNADMTMLAEAVEAVDQAAGEPEELRRMVAAAQAGGPTRETVAVAETANRVDATSSKRVSASPSSRSRSTTFSLTASPVTLCFWTVLPPCQSFATRTC